MLLLTVGEISKALGISIESIRYYVKEGLITPKQNIENNYWEYSSEDFMKLTDVLFYRSMNLNMKEIKCIMGGLALEEIGGLIDSKKNELIKEIKQSAEALHELTSWGEQYRQEVSLLGNYRIGPMPPEFRRSGYFEESGHMAKYLEECFDLDKEDWGSVSISFYYNINEKDAKPKRYLSIEGSLKVRPVNADGNTIEEKAPHCVITEVRESDDITAMVLPVIHYADSEGIALSGEFYGREDTNYFLDGKRVGLYKIYAPIKKNC